MRLQETTIGNKLYWITLVNGLYVVMSEGKEEYFGTYTQCKKWLENKAK